MAFSWNGPNEDNFDIYVKVAGPGEPVRVTTSPDRDTAPSWSPDGTQIACIRYKSRQHAEIFVVPALGGGAERKVSDVTVSLMLHSASLAWSLDGKHIAIGGRFNETEAWGIWLISVETGEHRRLTTASKQTRFDYGPAFSPDGRSVAFIRAESPTDRDLYIQRLTDNLAANGEPARVTSDHTRIEQLAWVNESQIAYCIEIVAGLVACEPSNSKRLARLRADLRERPTLERAHRA